MSKQGHRLVPVLCLLGAIAGTLVLPAAAVAQTARHLDLMQFSTGVPDKAAPVWPAAGAGWRELYPAFNTLHRQDDRIDSDHDLEVTGGDYVLLRTGALSPVWYRIAWAGPTYFLAVPGGGSRAYEPLTQNPPGAGPVGELWREIYPTYGVIGTVTAWGDANASVTVDLNDFVTIAGSALVVEQVGLDIVIEEGDPIRAESGTWSRVKALYAGD